MSWFNSVSQGSNEPQESSDCPGRFSAAYTRLRGLTEGTMPVVTQEWPSCATPSPEDFPSAPQTVSGPPSLENLSCSSASGAQTTEPEPISYVTLQEQRCVLSWFQGWTITQKERFMQDLLGKAVPGKVCTLLDSLSTLQVDYFLIIILNWRLLVFFLR